MDSKLNQNNQKTEANANLAKQQQQNLQDTQYQ